MAGSTASETIDVVVAADRNFRRQLAVTIAGISEFSGGVPHRVFVLHDGYDEDLVSDVTTAAYNGVELMWIHSSSSVLDSAILPSYLPTATLYRLRITDLLPSDVHRVIYLDTDVVVLGSLRDLWHKDLGDTDLAAVRDSVCPWAASPLCLDWRELGIAPDTPYFNAGVMLIPVARWRANRFPAQTLELLRRHAFLYGDQCALNSVADGNWTALAPHWNAQSGHFDDGSLSWIVESREEITRATEHPDIVHFTSFTGRPKPWEPRSASPFRDAWFDALDRTAWAGWRPDDSPLSRTRVLATRARRAGGVLLRG
ncbi:MAG TPA: glycosyltransferase family 8 protein [Acidimicrobiia bacterium]|jgi:lipopolysaccharide biosynthesis glycosyltransferase